MATKSINSNVEEIIIGDLFNNIIIIIFLVLLFKLNPKILAYLKYEAYSKPSR